MKTLWDNSFNNIVRKYVIEIMEITNNILAGKDCDTYVRLQAKFQQYNTQYISKFPREFRTRFQRIVVFELRLLSENSSLIFFERKWKIEIPTLQ